MLHVDVDYRNSQKLVYICVQQNENYMFIAILQILITSIFISMIFQLYKALK